MQVLYHTFIVLALLVVVLNTSGTISLIALIVQCIVLADQMYATFYKGDVFNSYLHRWLGNSKE